MDKSQVSILVILSNPQVNQLVKMALDSEGYKVTLCQNIDSARRSMEKKQPDLILIGNTLTDGDGVEYAAEVQRQLPAVPVILFSGQETADIYKTALQAGFSGCVCLPLRTGDFLKTIESVLGRAQIRRKWLLLETRRATSNLQKRVDEMETLARLGRAISRSLNLEIIFSAVVEAAVELTGAEEGSLMMADENTGELYVRASHNIQNDFRLPIRDSLAGSVIQSGQPVLINDKTPRRIKTSYLVHSLIYVPLQINDEVIGVLGVDNRQHEYYFREVDVKLLSTLAETTAVAIANARLFQRTTLELAKMETLLDRIQDGVLLINMNQELILANQVVCSALELESKPVLNQPFQEVIKNPELHHLLNNAERNPDQWVEFVAKDGRIFTARVTSIPEVGRAITLHDITYLKKMDRMKSDFVSTVSHDLRSPLTAIMGYVDLLERAGPVNDHQREFIRRVQNSVQNITTLINDLLNLGRIEAGMDTRREDVDLNQLILYSIDGFQKHLADKKHTLSVSLPETSPVLFSNPIQLRQMVDNLLENAIKYTPGEGKITVKAEVNEDQYILQVSDSGIGIPNSDVSYIFEKFFRASNVTGEVSGTGLGLSIVHSVVEANHGRIWVESVPGKGTTFTVMLPLTDIREPEITGQK